MSRAEKMEQVGEIMGNVFDIDMPPISESTSAEDIEEWDSLHHIRLIVAIERRYKVRFSNPEVESMNNIGDLINLIEQKLGR
jgi:acyl carrier protein